MELEELASTVWSLAGSESQLCQTAIIWLVLNRAAERGAAQSIPAICRQVRDEGQSGMDLLTAGSEHGDLSVPRFSRLVARILDVVTRRTQDPIEGARWFHRHNVDPVWAADAEPVAIIRPFLFYRSSSEAIALRQPLSRQSRIIRELGIGTAEE